MQTHSIYQMSVRFGNLTTFLLVLTLVACQPAGEEAPPVKENSSLDSVPQSFSEVFGDLVHKAADRSPHQFQGDFDGDGVMDQLFVVAVTGKAGDIQKGVTVWDSWSSRSIDPSTNLSDRQGVSLAVLHGSNPTQAPKAFILYDQRPISVLDAGAARDLRVLVHSSFSKESPELESMAKGDALVIPTEAGIDTYLYWDGTTYRFFEPEDVP